MRFIVLLLCTPACFFLERCSMELDVNAHPQADTTVVYALLDMSDTAQYVRITRSFGMTLDPATNTTIRTPLFFDSLKAFLVGQDDTIPLIKTDVSSEVIPGHPADNSIQPNYYYKTEVPLSDPGYLLVIQNPQKDYEVYSSTAMVQPFSVTGLEAGGRLNLIPGDSFTITWGSAKNGVLYQVAMRVVYYETPVGGTASLKYFDWNLTNPEKYPAHGIDEKKIYTSYFFSMMMMNLTEDDQVTRQLAHLDFFLTAAGVEVEISNSAFVAQAGLTSGYVLPVYSNVANGLGVFSSRYTERFLNITLTDAALNALACGNETKGLRFLNSGGVICQ